VLQSSSRRGFVERPFTGDGSLGAPGRALSARADVWTASERVYIGAAIASSLHAPPADEILIDGLPEAGDDDLKFQFMHRISSNVEGVRGPTSHATHVQTQIAFQASYAQKCRRDVVMARRVRCRAGRHEGPKL
jgi:hypothetical protein